MDPNHLNFKVFDSICRINYDWGGASVKEIVRFLNNEEESPYFGYTRGLNKVNREKLDIACNELFVDLKNDIESGDMLIGNEIMNSFAYRYRDGKIIYLYTQLMAHYLNQDRSFQEWISSNKDTVLFEPRMV